MKYIRVDKLVGDKSPRTIIRNAIIMFPTNIDHDHFALNIMRLPKTRILSAGFVRTDYNCMYVCHGKSVSLGLESHPDDTAHLNKQSETEL